MYLCYQDTFGLFGDKESVSPCYYPLNVVAQPPLFSFTPRDTMATLEQVNALHTALTAAQTQILNLSTEVDKLRIASDVDLSAANTEHAANLATVRKEASDAVGDLRQRLAAMEGGRDAGGGGKDGGPRSLINYKKLEPKIFYGKGTDDIKPWAKTIRQYCNISRPGFRVALEWAESQTTPITAEDIQSTNWAPATEVNVELYEYLQTVTAGEALVLIERFQDRGFEAWRQLVRRHNPVGGRFELRTMINILSGRSPCKTLDEVPAAADRLEKEIKNYETRSNMKFPEEFKLPLLTNLLPPKSEKKLKESSAMARQTTSRSSITLSATPTRRGSSPSKNVE